MIMNPQSLCEHKKMLILIILLPHPSPTNQSLIYIFVIFNVLTLWLLWCLFLSYYHLCSSWYHLKMSSPAVSSTSTPLYRVFRGLTSTQVIAVPSTEAEWLLALNEFKGIYLAGKWKECEAKCTRLLEAAKVHLSKPSKPSKSRAILHPSLLTCIVNTSRTSR